ncbi:MAG TPA: hypothetical protein VFJ02_15185 [Vicinamibacterales bacterium]|nr:hypothetical protein [Vicinamibacterales bacterium]
MMIPERPSLERRILSALEGAAGGGPRIPVLLGGCGTGRTSLLLRVGDLLGRNAAQFIDVERIATTPERMVQAIRDASPFALPPGSASGRSEPNARAAFDAMLAFLGTARAAGDAPATFLLDEFLELRTFESFPGLRSVLRDLVAALAASGNRFVLTSRYTARALRVLRDAPAQFEIVHVAPLSAAEIRATLPGGHDADRSPMALHEVEEDHALDELARLVQALSEGKPAYARMLVETATAMATRSAADPVSALAALLAPGGALALHCRYSYELRLHRARGYGALKAILEVLAEEEPLTLTEIALRLRRTPGSTKDYLSWLEDVDLIVAHQKRYSFTDPLMRLWVRLHCRPTPPSDEDIVREVHHFVMSRLPATEPTRALAMAGSADAAVERDKPWGIIEID